jgi:thioredoxin 1
VLKICIEKKYPILNEYYFSNYPLMTRVLTSADFDSTIATGVTLVDMYADWCGPCQRIAPIIEELAHEYEGKATITKLDVDASGDIAQRYGVMSIPTILIFKDGQLVDKTVGLSEKPDLTTLLDKHIA